MYGVSDAYKTAMHQAVQKFRLTGTSAAGITRCRSARCMWESWMRLF